VGLSIPICATICGLRDQLTKERRRKIKWFYIPEKMNSVKLLLLKMQGKCSTIFGF
jgi:hypothetical protein